VLNTSLTFTISELSEKRYIEERWKMYREILKFVITVAVILHCFGPGYGDGLEAKLAGAKLPYPLRYFDIVYDGADSVYIFGG
jgi:hypothetical protein